MTGIGADWQSIFFMRKTLINLFLFRIPNPVQTETGDWKLGGTGECWDVESSAAMFVGFWDMLLSINVL